VTEERADVKALVKTVEDGEPDLERALTAIITDTRQYAHGEKTVFLRNCGKRSAVADGGTRREARPQAHGAHDSHLNARPAASDTPSWTPAWPSSTRPTTRHPVGASAATDASGPLDRRRSAT
jgi:hypothetical protein